MPTVCTSVVRSICVRSACSIPSPRESTATSAPTPITTPRVDSTVRSGFTRIASMPTRRPVSRLERKDAMPDVRTWRPFCYRRFTGCPAAPDLHPDELALLDRVLDQSSVHEGDLEHLAERLYRIERELVAHLVRNVLEVRLVRLRDDHVLDAGTMRAEHLLLHAADREHAAAQRDLTGHRHVAPHLAVGHLA